MVNAHDGQDGTQHDAAVMPGLFPPSWFMMVAGRRVPHPLVIGAGALWLVLNLWGSWVIVRGGQWTTGPDWGLYVAAADRLVTGQPLYTDDALWRYSPIAAWIMVIVARLGLGVWRALHVVAVLTLRDWRWVALTLTTWPFWVDVSAGNTVVFAFVAGVHALRGSRIGGIVYIALLLLIPRPIQIPLAIWLLWKRPDLRVPAGLLFAAHAALVLISGQGPAWLAYTLKHGGDDAGAFAINVHPFPEWGLAWLVIGIPLAAVLTWRGRLGLASLALAPYWLAQYLLVGLWELVRLNSGNTDEARHADRVAGS